VHRGLLVFAVTGVALLWFLFVEEPYTENLYKQSHLKNNLYLNLKRSKLAIDWSAPTPGDRQNFAATIDGLFVKFVVPIEQAEGRPMSAGKITSYLDMPRTTVLRRLQELCDLKVIICKGT
jgi:hypothetical protein